MTKEKISIIGLGKLGLPLLSTFAYNGQKIIGIDVDQNKIKLLKNNELPFYESNLKEYLIAGRDNIEYSFSFEEVVESTDVAIILVNTPSDENGEFSNKYIYDALDDICFALNNTKKNDFLFIISSTVMPTSLDKFISKIEECTNKKLNENFGLVYIPDLVALGSVIKDFENPDVVILGESNSKYGDVAVEIYSKIFKNCPPIVRMSLIEAEISKVSLNAFITMKISFANFIGNISEKLNANANNITKALGFDKRISPYYFRSGLAFGGTCFPRDTWAFIKLADNLGLDACHIKATQKINDHQNDLLYSKVKNFKDKRIGIFGLSFKPNTYVTVESPGNILYERLLKENFEVSYFDNLILSNYKDLQSLIDECEVIVITHPVKIDLNVENKIIINPWEM